MVSGDTDEKQSDKNYLLKRICVYLLKMGAILLTETCEAYVYTLIRVN